MDTAGSGAGPLVVADAGRWSARADRLQVALVWGAWLVGTLALVLYVRHYTRNVPYLDDWSLVPVVTGHQPLNLRWLWAQHNEHRILLPKLIVTAMFRWITPDFRTTLYFNAMLLSAAAAMMVLLARRIRGTTRLGDIIIPVAILSLGQTEALILGLSMALVLSACLTYGLLSIFEKQNERPPWKTVLLVGSAMAALPLCGGGGLVMLPPLVLWMVGYLCWGWWSGRTLDRRSRVLGFVLLAASIALVGLYMRGYARPAHHPLPPSFAAIVRATLQFLSLGLSLSADANWMPAGLLAAAASAGTLAYLAWIAANRPEERARALGLAAILLATLSVACSIGVSRAGHNEIAGLANRYVSLSVPLIIVVYFAWLTYAPSGAHRQLAVSLAVVFYFALPHTVDVGRELGRQRLLAAQKVDRALRAGLPDSQVLDLISPALLPDREAAARWMPMLREAGLGHFKRQDAKSVPVAGRSLPAGAARR